MGVNDLRLLGYRDKTLEFEEHGKLKGDITKMIEELSPTRIITFYPGYSVHPDHEATADAVIEALGDIPHEKRPALQLVAFDNRTFDDLGEPDIVIDIEGFTERKLDVMAAHRSQTGKLLEDLAADTQQGDDARDRWMRYENFYSYEID